MSSNALNNNFLTILLETNSGTTLSSLDTEFLKLQQELIDKEVELSDLAVKLQKIQTTPSTTHGTSLGREFFYDQPKTPDEIHRELIDHISDFQRCK